MSTLKSLLVDDIRDLHADIIARTYKGAEIIADTIFLYDCKILLDHDLGPGKTGYDFINYLIEISNMPAEVFIVSSNPVGRDNIGRALVTEGYIRKSPHNFLRSNNQDNKDENERRDTPEQESDSSSKIN